MFRNMTMFALPDGYTLPTATEIAQAADDLRLKDPGPLENETAGFVPPMSGPELAWDAYTGAPLFAVGFAERILPASVVRDALAARAQEFEANTGRKPGKRAMLALREDVLAELLPKSHIRRTTVRAYIDHQARLVVCDTSSHKRAEAVVKLLRQALGSMPARTIGCEQGFGNVVRRWMHDGFPEAIGWGPYLALRIDNQRATYAGIDLGSDEIEESLARGMEPTCIALRASALTFRLHADMRLTGLRWEDELIGECQSAREAEEASHAIAVGEVRALAGYLREWFGWVA